MASTTTAVVQYQRKLSLPDLSLDPGMRKQGEDSEGFLEQPALNSTMNSTDSQFQKELFDLTEDVAFSRLTAAKGIVMSPEDCERVTRFDSIDSLFTHLEGCIPSETDSGTYTWKVMMLRKCVLTKALRVWGNMYVLATKERTLLDQIYKIPLEIRRLRALKLVDCSASGLFPYMEDEIFPCFSGFTDFLLEACDQSEHEQTDENQIRKLKWSAGLRCSKTLLDFFWNPEIYSPHFRDMDHVITTAVETAELLKKHAGSESYQCQLTGVVADEAVIGHTGARFIDAIARYLEVPCFIKSPPYVYSEEEL